MKTIKAGKAGKTLRALLEEIAASHEPIQIISDPISDYQRSYKWHSNFGRRLESYTGDAIFALDSGYA